MEEPLWKAQSMKGLISTDDAPTALRGSPLKKGAAFRLPAMLQLQANLYDYSSTGVFATKTHQMNEDWKNI